MSTIQNTVRDLDSIEKQMADANRRLLGIVMVLSGPIGGAKEGGIAGPSEADPNDLIGKLILRTNRISNQIAMINDCMNAIEKGLGTEPGPAINRTSLGKLSSL
jgi:hypothetical protein